MIGLWARVAADLEVHGRLARVSVVATRGSSPREVGADLLLRPDGGFRGTIGGGAFEWRAIELARTALAARDPSFALHDIVLGPDLGQCCGGRVTIAIEVLDHETLTDARRLAEVEAAGPFATRARAEAGRLLRDPLDASRAEPGLRPDGTLVERFGDIRRPLLLFGAGHVGRALVLALAPLPFHVAWIDPRPDAFPRAVPPNVTLHAVEDPAPLIAGATSGAFVLAMTHDHALDLAIVDAALRRDDLPHVGTVGSATKRARFSSRLLEMGHPADRLRRMVCPIGALGPRSKAPAVIAACVAVELLAADELARNPLGATGAGESAVLREERA